MKRAFWICIINCFFLSNVFSAEYSQSIIVKSSLQRGNARTFINSDVPSEKNIMLVNNLMEQKGGFVSIDNVKK